MYSGRIFRLGQSFRIRKITDGRKLFQYDAVFRIRKMAIYWKANGA